MVGRREIGMLVHKNHNQWVLSSMKSIVGAFSGHCATSQKFVGSSIIHTCEAADQSARVSAPSAALAAGPRHLCRRTAVCPASAELRDLETWTGRNLVFCPSAAQNQSWK